LDADGGFARRCNTELVGFDPLEESDQETLRALLEEHAERTGSPQVGAEFDGQIGPRPDTRAAVLASLRGRPSCPADWNRDGLLNPADVSAFVSTWFTGLTAGIPVGDFDGNGGIEPADVAAFVTAWFGALASGC
jgi:hypothetical protein